MSRRRDLHVQDEKGVERVRLELGAWTSRGRGRTDCVNLLRD
jgi:hypothetical protein